MNLDKKNKWYNKNLGCYTKQYSNYKNKKNKKKGNINKIIFRVLCRIINKQIKKK